jgi:hypothetical protein
MHSKAHTYWGLLNSSVAPQSVRLIDNIYNVIMTDMRKTLTANSGLICVVDLPKEIMEWRV